MEPLASALRLAGGMVQSLGVDNVLVGPEEVAPSSPGPTSTKTGPQTERQLLYQTNREVALLCSQNSISQTTFSTRGASITSLEMCFYNTDALRGFSYFPALTSLCVVTQDISRIEGLDGCPLLEKLWICETNIERIAGLTQLSKLKELYLIMENLHTLTQLRVLHIGNNHISSVGDALDGNMVLEDLNISGNLISSFREVLFLARLPHLTALCLSDPNFADNPICALCNYQTHVIYHLPNLRSLDTLDVTEDSRKIINATVLKKRM
ncbi:Leucine-rich repeat-containing protein 9 [Thoreauomyces humboldtii]|nr:Leucine-rich repeat-containing protein 9 [Thoreauomyces humboldtii]